MAALAAIPKGFPIDERGCLLTFVVPATSGCDLNCPFCIVRARRETIPSGPTLSVADYLHFVNETVADRIVSLIALQGYEPLLPDSWTYTDAILGQAKRLSVPSALITNGTHLAEHVAELAAHDVAGVTVSLDSSVAEEHDRSRQTPGAFDKALAGIQVARSNPILGSRLMVASTLQAGRHHFLDGMPALLASLGVQSWVVTPIYRIVSDQSGGTAEPHSVIVPTLVRLTALAARHGVTLYVDDEFEEITTQARSDKIVDLDSVRLRHLPRLDRVYRLTPNGSCSAGRDVLRRVDDATFHWNPGTHRPLDALAEADRRLGRPVHAKEGVPA